MPGNAGPPDDPDGPLAPALSAVRILSAEQDAQRQAFRQAAIGYTARGWQVVPLWWAEEEGSCACGKPECADSAGKHPIHTRWPEVATADQAQAACWWREEPDGPADEWYPLANIGLVTGPASGFFVLDVDTYAGGEQTLGSYERRNGPLPQTRVHSTPRGGTHYLFAYPGFTIRNSARRALGTGLDIRGNHGVIAAPPSVGRNGNAYEVNPAHESLPIAAAPDWLLAILRQHDREQAGTAISGAAPPASAGITRRYVLAALAAEAKVMRETAPGSRNDALNSCAFSLGSLGGAGLLAEEEAWQALHDAAREAGLGEGEIRATFTSGWRSGLKEPRVIQWREMDGEWPARPRTEFGNADRMADHWGTVLRYCPERDTWMVYRGGVWVTEVRHAAEWYAQQMLRSLEHTEALSYDSEREEVRGEEQPSPRDKFTEWVGKQHTRKAVAAAARLAMGVPLMRVSQGSFDQHPDLLNVRNGVVNLSTGELLPHDPEQLMTLQCAASFTGLDTPGPRWADFLNRVQPDPEMREYLQRVAGYAATGYTSEQVLFLMHGKGANGKSVWDSAVGRVLGGFGQTVPVEALMAHSIDNRIPNDVARMAGRRYLSASETRAGGKLDEQRIKQMTGGDTIAARYMRAEWFEFSLDGKIFMTTNNLPGVSDDGATWRRIRLITWPVIIPEEERDGFLLEKLLREESSAILAWIVRGAMEWHRIGLSEPAQVREAVDAYRGDEDIVAQFVQECLDVDLPRLTRAAGRDARSIWQIWNEWTKRQGYPFMGQKMLTTRLKKKYEYYRDGSWSGFPTLAIKPFVLPPE